MIKKAYTLNQKDNISTYNIIKAEMLKGHIPQENPTAIFLAGQQGAGKSTVANRHDGVLLNWDKYFAYHPAFEAFLRENPGKPASPEVHMDVVNWVQNVREAAKNRSFNTLEDQTLKLAKWANIDMQGYKEAGYNVEIHAVAVSPDLSYQRIYHRFEALASMLAVGEKPAHFACEVTRQANQNVVENVKQSIAYFEQEAELVDRVVVYTRDGQEIYDTQRDNNVYSSAAEAIEWQHRYGLNPEAMLGIANAWSKVVEDRINRNADEREILFAKEQYEDSVANLELLSL